MFSGSEIQFGAHPVRSSVRPTHVLSTSFTVANVANGSTFSGLRVGKFSVSEDYTPYKGVRGRAEGKIEWRW